MLSVWSHHSIVVLLAMSFPSVIRSVHVSTSSSQIDLRLSSPGHAAGPKLLLTFEIRTSTPRTLKQARRMTNHEALLHSFWFGPHSGGGSASTSRRSKVVVPFVEQGLTSRAHRALIQPSPDLFRPKTHTARSEPHMWDLMARDPVVNRTHGDPQPLRDGSIRQKCRRLAAPFFRHSILRLRLVGLTRRNDVGGRGTKEPVQLFPNSCTGPDSPLFQALLAAGNSTTTPPWTGSPPPSRA